VVTSPMVATGPFDEPRCRHTSIVAAKWGGGRTSRRESVRRRAPQWMIRVGRTRRCDGAARRAARGRAWCPSRRLCGVAVRDDRPVDQHDVQAVSVTPTAPAKGEQGAAAHPRPPWLTGRSSYCVRETSRARCVRWGKYHVRPFTPLLTVVVAGLLVVSGLDPTDREDASDHDRRRCDCTIRR
jgi:hypothetical protein